MRRSSCAAVMLLLCFSAGLPAVARAENDTHSITQRIGELRNRLDSFCGIAGKNAAVTSQPAVAKDARDASTDVVSSPATPDAKAIDGEKFVLLPADASEKSTANVTPEGESAAIEQSQNVKMTVLFHDSDAPAVGDKKVSSESTAKTAGSPATAAKKP